MLNKKETYSWELLDKLNIVQVNWANFDRAEQVRIVIQYIFYQNYAYCELFLLLYVLT